MSDAERQRRYYERHREVILQKKKEKKRDLKREYQLEKARKKKKPLQIPPIVGIDGEAHIEDDGKSVYSFLAATGLRPLMKREGLSTIEIFDYLFKIPRGTYIIGFVLNFDWEWWLKDIPDDAYLYLVGDTSKRPTDGSWDVVRDKRGDVKTNTIFWKGYHVTYYPRKMLVVMKRYRDGKIGYRKVMDVWGYCQSSFVKACEMWHVGTDDDLKKVEAGKNQRKTFRWHEMEYVREYNELELKLLVELGTKILSSLDEAVKIADLPVSPSANDLYGPGSLARKLMKSLDWPSGLGRTPMSEKHVEFFDMTNQNARDDTQRSYLRKFPIIASYYGGRIETSCTGIFPRCWDYDLHSAYPSAVTRLPRWEAKFTMKKFLCPEGGINWAKYTRALGMYYVKWKFPDKWYWYPFPVRRKNNVFFPRHGQGWIASPELFAVLDTMPGAEKYVQVIAAWTIPGKYGYGGGEKPLPDELKSSMASCVEKMYSVRAVAKKEGRNGAQLALKLILNSLYGKLLQQVGVNPDKPQHFHDLVASWITSWTRAMLWRAIAPYRKQKVILAIQTDGIVSKKKLKVPLSDNLGDWEESEMFDYVQLLPGVYRYYDHKEEIKSKIRGFTKDFDFEKAIEVLRSPGAVYHVKYRTFIGRRLYLAQPYAHQNQLYQWPELIKVFRPEIGAKRGDQFKSSQSGYFGECYLEKGETEQWLYPKINLLDGVGYPFELKFSETVVPREDWELEQAYLEEALDEEGGGFFRE